MKKSLNFTIHLNSSEWIKESLCKYIDKDPTASTTSGTLSYTGPTTGITLDTEYEYGDSSVDVLQISQSTTSTVKGHIMLMNSTDSSQFVLYTLSSTTDNSGYYTFTVSCVDSSTSTPFTVTNSPSGESTMTVFS